MNHMSKWIVRVTYNRVDNLKVVDKIPKGYQIWNIGGMGEFPTYLPLCVVYPGTYTVQLDKLLAIDLHDAKKARMLARCSSLTGSCNLKQAMKNLKKKCYSKEEKRMIEEAIPLLESISE